MADVLLCIYRKPGLSYRRRLRRISGIIRAWFARQIVALKHPRLVGRRQYAYSAAWVD